MSRCSPPWAVPTAQPEPEGREQCLQMACGRSEVAAVCSVQESRIGQVRGHRALSGQRCSASGLPVLSRRLCACTRVYVCVCVSMICEAKCL